VEERQLEPMFGREFEICKKRRGRPRRGFRIEKKGGRIPASWKNRDLWKIIQKKRGVLRGRKGGGKKNHGFLKV